MAVKSNSGKSSVPLVGQSVNGPVASWGPVNVSPNNIWSTISNSSESAQTQDYSRNRVEEKSTVFYHIDVVKMSTTGSLKMLFLTEEEFVFSYENLYNSLKNGERFALTADSIVNIESVDGIIAACKINGVSHHLSPFYLLKRAKELKNDK